MRSAAETTIEGVSAGPCEHSALSPAVEGVVTVATLEGVKA